MRRACCGSAPSFMFNLSDVANPILRMEDNLRDPMVFPLHEGYQLYYTRYRIGDWNTAENWFVARCFTRDFVHFSNHEDVSTQNFASPGDIVRWHSRLILPYQSYPSRPQQLHFVESSDAETWSAPRSFLPEALTLPWNTDRRAIDPSFVVYGSKLYCYFVGSDGLGTPRRANLLGHAVTEDPELREWTILSPDVPLMGRDRAPDGVENIVIYRVGERWLMLFSEGMDDQHLALAESHDLVAWRPVGRVDLPVQSWCAFRYGAPFVWREGDRYFMILMGEEAPDHRSSLGFLSSVDGLRWELCPERAAFGVS